MFEPRLGGERFEELRVFGHCGFLQQGRRTERKLAVFGTVELLQTLRSHFAGVEPRRKEIASRADGYADQVVDLRSGAARRHVDALEIRQAPAWRSAITKPKVALSSNRKSSEPASSRWEPLGAAIRLAPGRDHGVDAPQIVQAMAASAGAAAATPLRRNDEATASNTRRPPKSRGAGLRHSAA